LHDAPGLEHPLASLRFSASGKPDAVFLFLVGDEE